MFLRSTRLPSEGQMLYIFLYIDSTQGGWGRGMGNKSDKVAPSSVPFALTFPLSVPSLAQATFLRRIFASFFLFSTLHKRLFSSICICIALSQWGHSLHSMLGGLCNSRPDVLVLELWFCSDSVQEHKSLMLQSFGEGKPLDHSFEIHFHKQSWRFELLTLIYKVSAYDVTSPTLTA